MKEIARFLYGSQNYGLESADSDKDYKVIMCPHWNDLYTKRDVSPSDMDFSYDREHYSPIDCRQFDSLLHKCNPNILEIIYSIDFKYTNGDMRKYIWWAKELLARGYIALHWKEFYAASQGLALNALKRYGATRKTVSRAWYILKLVQEVASHDFSMRTFIWRNNWYSEKAREIRYKNQFTEDELITLAEYVKNEFISNKEKLEQEVKNWIDTHQIEITTLYIISDHLTDIMKNLVLYELKEELHFDFI